MMWNYCNKCESEGLFKVEKIEINGSFFDHCKECVKDIKINKMKELINWNIEFLEQFKEKPPETLHEELEFIINQQKEVLK